MHQFLQGAQLQVQEPQQPDPAAAAEEAGLAGERRDRNDLKGSPGNLEDLRNQTEQRSGASQTMDQTMPELAAPSGQQVRLEQLVSPELKAAMPAALLEEQHQTVAAAQVQTMEMPDRAIVALLVRHGFSIARRFQLFWKGLSSRHVRMCSH